MAQPHTFSAKLLLIQLGDGGAPETFSAPCGLTTRGIQLSKETNDTTVPDCDDPDLPAWTERDVVSLSGEISGSGILAGAAVATWRAAYFSTDSVTCRVRINDTGANGGGYFQGEFHLTQFNITGEIGNKAQVEVTLVSDGEITWTAAA